MTIIDVEIATGADDGYWKEDDTSFNNNLTVINVGSSYGGNHNLFLRFDNLTISGSIVEAYITLYAYETTTLTSCNIKGVDAADPAAPTSYSEAENATRTTAVVPWTVGTHTVDVAYQTPDIKTIIQELVDSYTYNGTQAIIIYIESDGTDVYSRYKTYENSLAQYPAELHVEYNDGGGAQVITVPVVVVAEC